MRPLTDSADATEDQQLGVAARQTGQPAGDRDDEDSGGHDDPFAEDLDQPAAERAGDLAHQGERRNDRADFSVSNAEAPGKHW